MRELTPVREAIVAARRRLQAMGVPSPQVDARLLAAHVLDVEPAGLAGRRFTAQQAQRFEQLVAQREQRVPLQHLTGVAYFRYLSVAVGPGVFIPRPETEVVAGAAIAAVAARLRISPITRIRPACFLRRNCILMFLPSIVALRNRHTFCCVGYTIVTTPQ